MALRSISPTADQRTSLGTGIKGLADPFQYKRLIFFGSQCALICDDSTVSSPVWRVVSLASAASTSYAHPFDFAVSDGGWTTVNPYGDAHAVYTASTGWRDNSGNWYNDGNSYYGVDIFLTMPAGTKTRIDVTYTVSGTWPSGGVASCGVASVNGSIDQIITSGCLTVANTNTAAGTHTVSWIGSTTATALEVVIGYGTGADPTGTITITKVIVYGPGSDPFGGGSGGGTSADETFINDMVGTINQQGYFGWLAKKTVSGTDYIYYSYTTNYFKTIKTTQVAKWIANMPYTISMSGYGRAGALVLYVTAGDTGGTDAKVYKSTNSGKTFSATSQAITARGGCVNISYKKSGGAANGGTSPQFALIKGHATDLKAVSLAASTVTLATGTSHYPIGPYSLQSFTLDGSRLYAILENAATYMSDDGGATWSAVTTPTMSGSTAYGVTSSPQNKAFLLAFGDQLLSFSANSGNTWTNIWTAYDAFRSSAFGSTAAKVIVSSFIDLNLLYSRSVVNT